MITKTKLQKTAQTFLITGSAGFIGFSIAKRLLEAGHTVIGVDSMNDYYDTRLKGERNKILKKFPKYLFHKVDISDYKKLQTVFSSNSIDAVIHLAAQAGVRYSYENPMTYVKNNVNGTANVFELARLHSIPKVIYASSSSVYGNEEAPHHEEKTSTDKPISMYAATKKTTELFAHAYNHSYGTTMIGLRFFTVYGPWSRPDMSMIKFAKAISLGEAVTLYDKGMLKRSFTYIDDIVDGVISSLTIKKGNHIINIGGGSSIEVRELVTLIEQNLNKKAKRVMVKAPRGDVKETNASQDIAQAKLRFSSKTSFSDGVQKFCEWFTEHKEFILSLDSPKQ